MQKALPECDKPLLLLPKPVTKVTEFEFVLNSLCSAISHDFIIFDDVSTEEERFVQFALNQGIILDFPAMKANDNGKYFKQVAHVLKLLGFKNTLANKPKRYFILHAPGDEGETTIRANFGFRILPVIKFVTCVYEVVFKSDVRQARIVIDDFPKSEEDTPEGSVEAPQLIVSNPQQP